MVKIFLRVVKGSLLTSRKTSSSLHKVEDQTIGNEKITVMMKAKIGNEKRKVKVKKLTSTDQYTRPCHRKWAIKFMMTESPVLT